MIGVIGGTGLYRMEELKVTETVEVETPFGVTSPRSLCQVQCSFPVNLERPRFLIHLACNFPGLKIVVEPQIHGAFDC